MQSAKDTFYITLRDRLAAFHPTRTMVVRGAVRPAVFVAENELVAARDPLEAFVVSWADVAIDTSEPLPLHAMQCEIAYATRGTTEALGMDRGRVLDAMDRELRVMLQPASAAKGNFATSPVTAETTTLFWSEPRFGRIAASDGQIGRTVLPVCRR